MTRNLDLDYNSESDQTEDQLAIPSTYNVHDLFWNVAYKDYSWKKTFTAHDRHDVTALYIKEKGKQQDYMNNYHKKISHRFK